MQFLKIAFFIYTPNIIPVYSNQYEIAPEYLRFLAISVSCERLFSKAGFVKNPTKKPAKVQQNRIGLSHNSNLLNSKKESILINDRRIENRFLLTVTIPYFGCLLKLSIEVVEKVGFYSCLLLLSEKRIDIVKCIFEILS